MSSPRRSHLPPEILDHTVDFLHDEPGELKQCCLVSRSWVPRARKHLFADVEFVSKRSIKAWKKAFPNPSRSPAHYTRKLVICCVGAVTVEDAQEGGWLHPFSRVVRLELDLHKIFKPATSLVPFYRFSPSVKSLYVIASGSLPCTQIVHLVYSLPLLEDLSLTACESDEWDLSPTINLSTPPPLTGTLQLCLAEGIGTVARQLLDLPNGPRFRKLILLWRRREDLQLTGELVVACSDVLECLDVAHCLPDDLGPAPIDLSRTTKLRDAIFRPRSLNVGWITRALQAITYKHRDLRQILIYMFYSSFLAGIDGDVGHTIGEEIHRQWLELDSILIQFWESRSIRPRLTYMTRAQETQSMQDYFERLLPGTMKWRIIDLVICAHFPTDLDEA